MLDGAKYVNCLPDTPLSQHHIMWIIVRDICRKHFNIINKEQVLINAAFINKQSYVGMLCMKKGQ